jgi:glycosyltransferase involved in cell wall biosynthesis
VVSYFPPDRIGGVGEVVAHLHRGLLAAGHDSVVVTTGTTRDDPRVYRIATTPLGFVTGIRKQFARVSEFDIVHCHQGDALLLALSMRLRRVRTSLLATYHVGHKEMAAAFRPYEIEGRIFGRGWKNWKYRHLIARIHHLTDRLMFKLADETSFIAFSSAVDVIGPERAASANIIYNALPDWDGAVTEPLPETTELLYVGTDRFRKRLHNLPFVLKKVRESIPDARLRLIGVDLDNSPDLKGLFQELGQLDSVVSEGRLLSHQIRPFYLASQVLVVPSAYEGLPMVILEAFQCGLPCVATCVGGHPEVIEERVNGFLVEKDQPDQMAQRCVEILRDPALRRRMSKAGRPLVADRFGVQRQAREYIALYERLCRRPHSSKL